MTGHGGDIYRNKVDIDFSVNVSPYGVPAMVMAAISEAVMDVSSYPDPLYEELRMEIGKAEDISHESIVCGNGASELIFASLKALHEMTDVMNAADGQDSKKTAAVLVPGFLTYETAIRAAGYEKINRVYLNEEEKFIPGNNELCKLIDGSSVIILGNPNNPTGRLLPLDWIKELIEQAEEKGIYVILDETFLPLTDRKSDYEGINSNNLIRIRAYTKSMAIPGIRTGYLICDNKDVTDMVKSLLPDWNVSVIASRAGVACAKKTKWLEEKVSDPFSGIKVLRDGLSYGLKNLGIRVYESDTDFLLIYSDIDLYSELLSYGILIRDCSNFEGLTKGYYRVAVKSTSENEYLIEKIREIVGLKANDENVRPVYSVNKHSLLSVKPAEIEKKSFEILSEELLLKGINTDLETAPIVKRCIHTTADFQYATTLCFSKDALNTVKKLIREGASIVTDTNMALSGINKKELEKYGSKVYCFMADPDIAQEAKRRGCTRATVSMEHASKLSGKVIITVGNAPTALVTLCEMMDRGEFTPDFIIGVPVGFVNVEQAKEMVIERKLNYIVNRGRKGGSNVAAAIVNAVLYSMRDE